MAMGGSVVWLHPRASTADHERILSDSDATALFLDEEFVKLSDHFRQAASLHVAPLTDSRQALLEEAHPSELILTCQCDDIALLGYTGGTTGVPKAVVRRQSDWAYVTRMILAAYPMPDTPQFLCVGPISHVTGTKVVPALLRGGTVYMLKSAGAEKIIEAMQKWSIDSTLLVPTVLDAVVSHLRHHQIALPTLKRLFYGGSAIAPENLKLAFQQLGPVLHQVYGQTEGYPVCGLSPEDLSRAAEDADDHVWRSCGWPSAGIEVRLVDEAGGDVAKGEVGELCARGRQVMTTYWKRPEETAATLRNGWLRTGDLARQHSDGCFEIVGRSKDMVITGGFNVYARDIEIALEEHPAVDAAAVFGIPHEKWGEAVVATVVLKAGMAATQDQLVAWVKERKGSFQAPKQLRFVDALPLTSLGKVDKKLLRQGFGK